MPVKSSGFGGAVKIGKPLAALIAEGVSLYFVAQADVANVQAPPKANESDSA